MTDYYDPEELYREGVPVYLRINEEDVIGYAKFTAAGVPRWRLGTPRESVDLPKRVPIDGWRPIKPEIWGEPLPEPKILRGPVDYKSAPEPQSEPESHIGDDWWVNPRTRLGTAGEAPVSELECEIRILRWICTRDALDYEPKRVESCWPKDLEISARVVQKHLQACRTGVLPGLRQEDYRDFHTDTSELEARIARWDATARDVSDVESWPTGSGPWSWPDANDMHLFVLRSERHSTMAIARAMRIPEKDIVESYRVARARAFERAIN